ncbi:MAG: S-layer homology domain-containing protein, partial [Clostridiales bacterium]|nr:S-layer homology domain-containing protein [Clostridiales bacterium]
TDVYSDAALRYADVSVIAAWALPYVRYAYQTGLMQGSDGCFNPYGVLSREQAMTVIERMIMKYGW